MSWSVNRRGMFLVLGLLAAWGLWPSGLSAQSTVSNVGNISLTAKVQQQLTVTLGANAVNFSLNTAGAAVGTPTIPITTTWAVSAINNIQVVAYLDSATISLTNGVQTIPSNMVFGSLNGSAYVAFTQAGTCVGCSLVLFNQTITSSNLSGTRTDNLSLKIDLTSTTAATIPAGTYIGTVHIQAIAT